MPRVTVDFAREDEFENVARVFLQGLRDESAPWAIGRSPWDDWIAANKLSTVDATRKWFENICGDDHGRMLAAGEGT